MASLHRLTQPPFFFVCLLKDCLGALVQLLLDGPSEDMARVPCNNGMSSWPSEVWARCNDVVELRSCRTRVWTKKSCRHGMHAFIQESREERWSGHAAPVT